MFTYAAVTVTISIHIKIVDGQNNNQIAQCVDRKLGEKMQVTLYQEMIKEQEEL